MAHEEANQHSVLGELRSPGLGELTAMRRLDIEGNPGAYHLKVFRSLDGPRLRKQLIDYHSSGLPLASRLKALFSGSLVSEIAIIRLVECRDLSNQRSKWKLEIIGRDCTKSDLANEGSLQLMVNRITTYENCTRYLDCKANLTRARMVLLISEQSRFNKLLAKAGKKFSKSNNAV